MLYVWSMAKRGVMKILIIVGMLLITSPLYANEKGKANSSPRLKFKNGPVCMCAKGLSEKDIQAGKKLEWGANESGTAQDSQLLETSRHRDSEDE